MRMTTPAPVLGLLLSLTAALPSLAAPLIVSGNDGKTARVDGVYVIDVSPRPDTLVVLDAASFPPRILGQAEVDHSVSAPPSAVAITPDGHLVLLAAPNRVDPADPTKAQAESFLQAMPVRAGGVGPVMRIALPHQPLSVAISHDGRLALTVQIPGELSVFDIAAGKVDLRQTLAIGGSASRTSAVAITPDGRWALVAFRGEDAIGILPITGGQIGQVRYKVPVGHNPYVITIAPNGRFAVTGNIGLGAGPARDSISVIDLTSQPFKASGLIAVPANPEGLAISPDSRWFAVSSINGTNAPLSSAEHHDHGTLTLFKMEDGVPAARGVAPTGHNAQGVVFTPDSRHLLVQDYMEETLSAYRVGPSGPVDTGLRVKMPGRPASIASNPG